MFDMKSKKIYDGWISKYTTFCEKEKITDIDSLASLLKFFVHQSAVYSASTLWQGYSCLGKYFLVFHNKDIKENLLLKQLLKKKQKYHKVKKSMVLSKEELDLFLQNTEDQFVVVKCALAIRMFGLSRISELVNLCFENVKKKDDTYEILISESKTDCKKKGFFFFVVPPYSVHIENYIKCFPEADRCDRFFS